MADQDTNSMQDSLGLGRGSMAAEMGRPTPPVNLPPTKHPGQISAELMAQSTQQAQVTSQLARMSAPGTFATAAGIYNPAISGFGGSPALGMFSGGGMGMPMGGGFASQAVSTFGMQFSANQAAIAANRPSPFGMYGGMPLQGFNYGMMPQPAALTDPTLGIFRTRLAPGNISPMYPAMPREPLFTAPPFIQPLPSPRFGTPFETGAAAAQMTSAQMHGYALAGTGVAARGALDIGGAAIGARLGAAAGSVFGPIGAGIGGLAGGALGFLGADAGFGRAAGALAAEGPLATVAQRAAQVRGISNNFVVGGSDLNYTGRGFNAAAAIDTGRAISNLGYSGATGFNPSDLTRIMSQGSKAGLFDAMQSAGDVRGQLVRVAQSLREFMQLANEPDVVNAVRQLGNMRTQGLSPGEALRAAQNTRTFARMAGTNLAGMVEAGQAGAFVAQQQGLTAGLGSQLGQAGRGLAQMAIAGGAYTPQQLALLGGAAGIGQRQAEMGVSFLQVPMVAASAARFGADGRFGLDPAGVRRLAQGQIDIPGMALSATDNLNRAVARGGTGALAMYMMQQRELQDQLGRQLGPVGTQMSQIQQLSGLMRLTGQGGPQGAALAAMMMNPGNPDAARQMYGMATSPGFYRNAQRQLDVSAAEQGGMVTARRRAMIENQPSEMARLLGNTGLAQGFRGAIAGAGEMVDSASRFFTEYAEDSRAEEQGLTISRVNRALLPANEEEMAGLRKYGIARGADSAPASMRAAATGLITEGSFDLFSGGEDAALKYLRGRQGRSNSAMALGLAKIFGSEDPASLAAMEQQARDYSDAAFKSGDIMNATADQRSEAAANLSKRVGGADVAQEMQLAYVKSLTDAAEAAKGATGRQMIIEGSETVGSFVGGSVGMTAGASMSSAAGPVGTFAGGAAGMMAGSYVGGKAGNLAGRGIAYTLEGVGLLGGDASVSKQQHEAAENAAIAVAERKKGGPLSSTEREQVLRDLRQSSGTLLQGLTSANAAAFDTDTGTGAFDKARMARTSKEGVAAFEAAGDELFKGKYGVFSADGTDEEHVRSLTRLFGKGQSSVEAALTSLFAAVNTGEAGERDDAQKKIQQIVQEQKLLETPEGRSVIERAKAAAETMGDDEGVQANVARAGRMSSNLSVSAILKRFEDPRNAVMQNRAVIQMQSTVDAIERTGLTGREDLISAFRDKGTQGLLDAIKAKGGGNYLKGSASADVLGQLYGDYEKAAAAGDPLAQKKAMEAFANGASDFLPRSASSARSGEVVGSIDGAKGNVARTMNMMSGAFVGATQTFAGAVPTFAQGAQMLFRAMSQNGTALPIPSGGGAPGRAGPGT